MSTALKQKQVKLALIGDPVSESTSHIKHKNIFDQLDLDASYTKIRVTVKNIAYFIQKAKQEAYTGLSVTMPLKETIISYLDQVDPDAKAMGAVNTVLFHKELAYGYNTDGIGALRAIQNRLGKELKEKQVIILGAGGVARAIAYVLVQHQAQVCIINRSLERAKTVAQATGATWDTWESLEGKLKQSCDLFVQATSVGMQDESLPIDPCWLQPSVAILEVINKKTPLLKYAQKNKHIVISGLEMWVEQALEQYRIWFGDMTKLKQIRCSSQNST